VIIKLAHRRERHYGADVIRVLIQTEFQLPSPAIDFVIFLFDDPALRTLHV
jgi:hypothetical protein